MIIIKADAPYFFFFFFVHTLHIEIHARSNEMGKKKSNNIILMRFLCIRCVPVIYIPTPANVLAFRQDETIILFFVVEENYNFSYDTNRGYLKKIVLSTH